MVDRIAFRTALAQRLGQTLTPELCAELEVEACRSVDRAYRPSLFEPFDDEDYRIQVERFNDVLPELHPLHEAHWLETEKHRHGLELKPDYAGMAANELAGRLLQFTLRHRGLLVGQVRMYVTPSAHTENLQADEDTLYIAPAHRTGFLGIKLLRYVEGCLRQIGVREISANSKLVNGADALMRRMKYDPVAIQYHKIIEGQP